MLLKPLRHRPLMLDRQWVKGYADYGDSRGMIFRGNSWRLQDGFAGIEPELKAGDDVAIEEREDQKAQKQPEARHHLVAGTVRRLTLLGHRFHQST